MFNFKKRNIFNRKFSLAIFTAFALTAFAAISQITEANNIRWYISPSDPYIQTWADTVSINANDNWDNFIAINGYRGDDLTTGTGTNPQTVLADGAGTPLDVIANQNNPNALADGGVAEFDGIANPTIALQGSGTADAPHLVIALNRASCPDTKFISISYKVRDIDGSADNAVQQVALHYRVGTTGNYTNLPDAFVADATNPNTATKVTSVVGNLPHIPVSVNEVYLRIMTTNAAGNDEWVGIDDISVGCYAPLSANVPVSGRVLSRKSGVARASVTMTDDAGNTQAARTNSFGNYRFDSVESGKTYTISVFSKGHQFAPQIVSVEDSISDLDFYAQE